MSTSYPSNLADSGQTDCADIRGAGGKGQGDALSVKLSPGF